VYVLLLSVRRPAGVLFGIDSEASSEFLTTHPPNGAVGFPFCGKSQFSLLLKSTGGEVANARVCKTCIRGFDSRPVLQISTVRLIGGKPS
jgi:hypothetical protein